MPAPQGTRFAEHRGGQASGPVSAPLRRCPSCGEQYPLDFVVCPKDATTLELPDLGDDPLIGEVLAGTFCITGLIGEGGMGRVYEAEHVRLPKRFAIKVMLEELVKHPDALSRFEREAQAVARVTSEHVIEVVDLVRLKDSRPCLVTELLEGQELGELLEEKGKMPIATAITIARQVCRGLAAAHAVGIIHRDLKPSNLFLVHRTDGKPFVKVLDFGVAKLSDGAQLTRTGMVVGTPAYMSPEQARGDKSVDERADVYSLGAVLYHMLTGSPPFIGDEPGVVLTRVLTEDPQRLKDLERSIPDDIEHLVQRAMARTPEGRPRTIVDFERDLAAFDKSGDAPSGRAAMPTAHTIGTRDTVLESAASPREMSSPSVGARFGRYSAMAIAVCWAGLNFALVLAGGAAALRMFSGRGRIGDMELVLLFVVAGIVAVLALASAGRALSSRWRSAPAVDRLAGVFAAAAVSLLALAGFITVALSDYALLGPPPNGDVMQYVEIGTFAGPLMFAFLVFFWGIRRAGKS